MYFVYIALAIILIYLYARRGNRLTSLLTDPKSRNLKKIKHYYEKNFLIYTNIKLSQLMWAKGILFVITVGLCIVIKLTNINVFTQELLTKFDYRNDLLMQDKVDDQSVALKQEIFFLEQALQIPEKEIMTSSKEDIEFQIKGMAEVSGLELAEKSDVIANKVYYRLLDYYKVRQVPYLAFIFWGLIVSAIPEMYLKARTKLAINQKRKELIFLKRIMIVNGSIKPVDFISVLKDMIGNATYHKKILDNILLINKLNTIDNAHFYRELISKEKDLNTKLFYEKLDMANNYDFNQAVTNIKNEFYFARREEARRVRKRIEMIHIVGITGFMILIGIYMLYLIIPWLTLFDMNQII